MYEPSFAPERLVLAGTVTTGMNAVRAFNLEVIQ